MDSHDFESYAWRRTQRYRLDGHFTNAAIKSPPWAVHSGCGVVAPFNHNTREDTSRPSFLAETSARPPRKLLIFIIQ